MKIAVLHPGEMGVSIANGLVAAGQEVGWVSEGRSPATQARGGAFLDLGSFDEMANWAEAVISVCPPGSAVELAEAVEDTSFDGLFVDANAVAPQTAETIGELFGERYVDGGIVGPPAHQTGTTRLYLSGSQATQVPRWFAGSFVDARVIGVGINQASALKMAYAAYTKGSSALLLGVAALAEAAGVREQLEAEWELSQPGLVGKSRATSKGTSRKAWRFVGEMEEIAKTFRDHDLPGEFHLGARDIYQRMSELRDLPPAKLDEVLDILLKTSEQRGQS